MRAPLLAAVALLLAGCGSPAEPAGLSVVASTDVYGAIATAVGGPDVRVTSLIHSPDADPHEYESTPADALAVGRATVVVQNGAGYDDFLPKIVAASGARPATVEVAALSGRPAGPDVNEHFWYDLPTVAKVADAVATDLGTADPARAATFTANAKSFDARIADLQAKVAAIKSKHAGAPVAVTEPVPLYLVEAAGLKNVTPPEFSEAVEKGSDPPAAVLTATLARFTGPGKVAVLLENAQTEGPTTAQAENAARANGVPIVKVTETLPAGVTDYVAWMDQQIGALAAALDQEVR